MSAEAKRTGLEGNNCTEIGLFAPEKKAFSLEIWAVERLGKFPVKHLVLLAITCVVFITATK